MAIWIDQGLPARPVFKGVPVDLEDQAGSPQRRCREARLWHDALPIGSGITIRHAAWPGEAPAPSPRHVDGRHRRDSPAHGRCRRARATSRSPRATIERTTAGAVGNRDRRNGRCRERVRNSAWPASEPAIFPLEIPAVRAVPIGVAEFEGGTPRTMPAGELSATSRSRAIRPRHKADDRLCRYRQPRSRNVESTEADAASG